MAGNDIYSILMGSEPEAADSARAMANAIRRNRNFAMGAGLGAADPLGAMGKSVADFGKQDEGLMEKAAVARLHYAPQAQEMKERQAMMDDPSTQGLLSNIATSFGRGIPDIEDKVKGSSARALLGLINPLEKYRLSQDALAQRQSLAELLAQNKRGREEAKYHDKAIADLHDFAKTNDPAKQARSALGVAAQNMYRAKAAMPLIKPGEMVPPQFLHDVAINLARIAGSGGNIGEEMAKRLEATGWKSDLARLESYLSSKPVDTGMMEWMNLLNRKLTQEIDTAETFARNSVAKQFSGIPNVAKYAPNELKALQENWGLSDFMKDDMISPVAPGVHAGVIGRRHIEEGRAKLSAKAPPGSRLAFDQLGNPKGLAPGEALPSGWWEAKD